ncbi:MAG: hypothetical protein ACRET4_07290, partial [Steroidobacteraceae bacterium]
LTAAPLTCVERWVWAHCNAERLVANRRRNYRRLAQHLASMSGGTVLFPAIAEGAVPYVLPFHVPDAERVYPRLRVARLPVFRWDRFWPGSPSAEGAGALDWGHRVIQVSCHQDLTDADVDVMAEQIAQALR